MHKIIAYNDGELPALWTVEAVEGGYRCRIWALDPDRFPEPLEGLSGNPADMGAPDSDVTLAELAEAEGHFGTDYDQALQSRARAFVNGIQ